MGNTVSTRAHRGILYSSQIIQSRAFSSKVQNKVPSRYGKILRESNIHRGRRSGRVIASAKESGISHTGALSIQRETENITGHLEASVVSTSVQNGQRANVSNPTVNYSHPGYGGIGSPIRTGPLVGDHQSREESGHSVFDQEYFSGIVDALNNSGPSVEGDQRSRDESGHHVFDQEYFGGIVDALTDSGGKNAGGVSVGTDELNPVDKQFFETSTRESADEGSDQSKDTSTGYVHPATSEVPHEYSEPTWGRASFEASDGYQENLFDGQYFGNAIGQSADRTQQEQDFQSIGDEVVTMRDFEHFNPLIHGAIPLGTPPGTHQNFLDQQFSGEEIPYSSTETPSVAGEMGGGEQETQTVGGRGTEEHQPSMDTGLSESDVFWHSFIERETRRKMSDIDESPASSVETYQDFTPAEEAQGLDTSTGDVRDEFTMSSLSSRGIHLSEADRVKLELDREILEHNAQQHDVSIRNKSLEPEVREVYLELHEKKKVSVPQPKTSQEIKLFGTPDATIPVSVHSCTGCGALLHCQEITRPGYLPSERFRSLAESEDLDDAICQRCWHFVHHKQALNINLNAVDHEKIISEIRTKKANVLLMVDLMDFPCSVIPNLKLMVGERTPMFIVGNKFDLLPKDSPDYQRRVERILLETCIREGVCAERQVVKVQLISAKTGFGVEKLITHLQKMWGTRRDVYLLGTANIGKSTLFKTLLNSDFSKAKASYLIKEPTISPWPGTTLNLLKFPIMRPRGDKLAVRSARLKEDARRAAEEKNQKKKFERSKIRLGAYVEGKVGRSFSVPLRGEVQDETTDETVPAAKFDDPFSTMHPDISRNPAPVKRLKRKDLVEFRPIEFDTGKWLYDTPGVLHDRQVLPHLTMAELNETLANRVIVPRSLVMKPGQVMFLGGLGRLDYVQGKKSVYFTVFASQSLPVRYCTVEEADQFYETHAGHRHLRVPIGGEERMKTFPKLVPTDLRIEGISWKESVTDILLSSAGWVAITAGPGMEVHLRAFTPNGHGCFTRSPALLPFAINLKGKRPDKNKPFYVPDPKAVLRFR